MQLLFDLLGVDRWYGLFPIGYARPDIGQPIYISQFFAGLSSTAAVSLYAYFTVTGKTFTIRFFDADFALDNQVGVYPSEEGAPYLPTYILSFLKCYPPPKNKDTIKSKIREY